jgi:carboxypeptidase C (cathepsin A)
MACIMLSTSTVQSQVLLQRDKTGHHHKNVRLGRTGLITNLPGLGYNPGFRQYSGYLTVSEEHGRNIFYWYIESQNDPETDPVVLWTNGGPGCSGLMGLLEEHGPFIIDEKLQLSPNPYSWNKVANMLYIEIPAGVGFSYSKQNTHNITTGDVEAAKDNYQLILEFFKRYPERKSNDFYIASESYGGHFMPQRTFILHLAVSARLLFVAVSLTFAMLPFCV